MTTMTGLRTEVLDDLNRTDLTAAAETALQNAKKFYEVDRWWFNERRAKIGTEPNEERLPLPDDYLEVDNLLITFNNNTYVLRSQSKYDMDRMFVSGSEYTSVPEDYCIYDSQIRLYPIPDATYSITMSYQFIMADLTASTSNAWTNEMGQLLRHRAVADLYLNKLHNSERASIAKAQEELHKNKLMERGNQYFNDAPLKGWLLEAVMAEGSFRVYQSFMQAGGNLSDVFSATLAMGLVKSSYTPSTSHSAWSQVVGNAASASATMIDHIMTGVTWEASASVTQLVMDNHNWTAGSGELTAQYAVLFSEPTGRLIAIAELSTADVKANQINLTLGTVLRLKDSSGMY